MEMKLVDSRVRSIKPDGASFDAYITEVPLIGQVGYEVEIRNVLSGSDFAPSGCWSRRTYCMYRSDGACSANVKKGMKRQTAIAGGAKPLDPNRLPPLQDAWKPPLSINVFSNSDQSAIAVACNLLTICVPFFFVACNTNRMRSSCGYFTVQDRRIPQGSALADIRW